VSGELVARVEALHVRFGDVRAVDGLSFDVRAGECLALVGESGSGKTVTSRALLGLVPAPGRVHAGTLEILGEDARGFDERRWQRLRGRAIGLIAQDALVSLDPLRTVGREVAEALEIHAARGGDRLGSAGIAAAVEAELAHVAIPDPAIRARQYAHELSGGLRQRALIAAATITHPALLIADEPTTALDVSVQAQVLDLLDRLKGEGAGLLLISHDLALVARIAERVAVMRAGRVVESGATSDVLGSPEHPYTRALLAANPSLHERRERLSSAPALELSDSATIDRDRVVVAVRDVHQSFRRPDGSPLRAVAGVSFELRAGRTVGIVGESGSGKTTLGRIVLGLQRPDAGEVLLDGAAWSSIPEGERRRRRHEIQAVYQDPLSSFDPRHTVGSILGEALALGDIPRGDRHDRAVELAGLVGLGPELLGRRPRTLSGGQRQRVAIARALTREPRVLVCDEPVSALDVSIQAQVLDLLADLQDRLGLAMIFISHDLGVIHHISDDVLVMKDGVIVERGPSDELFASPTHPYTRALLAAVPARPAPASTIPATTGVRAP
jgi:peptide/nickel transport system ATP-binding protein